MRYAIALLFLACGDRALPAPDATPMGMPSPPVCANGSTRCHGIQVQTCVGGQWAAPVSCPAGKSCSGGVCATP